MAGDPISKDQPRALKDRLERLGVEARFDPYTRVLFSTDASNYQIEPLGVAFPRHEEDLFAIVSAAAEFRIPLIARGAGTSLCGQVIGRALIVDCSRHLNQIHRLEPEALRIEVAPGLVGAALNAAAGPHGLMLGPDPASADRATVGGMIGNNATGAHSIRYGMTADHVLEAEVILSDGSSARFSALSEAEAVAKSAQASLEGAIYRTALELRQSCSDEARATWPRTWRSSAGYGLGYLIGWMPAGPSGWYAHPASYPPHSGLNLAPLLCGSEGTLALVRRATLNLVRRPAATILVVIAYESIDAACEATPGFVETRPAAVELIPRSIISRARAVPGYARKLGFVDGDPPALLAVEYAADTAEEALALAGQVARRGRVLKDPQSQADLWAVRKVGLGLLLSIPGDVKPISFLEDVAVPVDRLAEYVRRMDQLLAQHQTRGEWYAHASSGCLHMRPLVNLKTGEGVARMRSIAEGALDIVLELGGTLSGEHGDGLARTEFNAKLFGPQLYEAFRKLKRAFDPADIFNPGKIVAAEGEPPPAMDRDLRYGPTYRAQEMPTAYAFRRDGGMAHAIEDCIGAGVCLQTSGGMCPSYQATREERHTTRGRANALRAAISGRLPPGALTSREMYQVMDLCLQCKACKAECPSAVDMAQLKSQFLDLYQAEHGLPLRSRLFGEIAAVSRLAAPIAPPVNWAASLPASRWLLEKLVGVSRERTMPKFQRLSFRHWWKRHPPVEEGRPVILFVDTFVDHNHPQVGRAAVAALEAAGCRVQVAPNQECCGRAMISKGMLGRAREMAARNLEALAPFVEAGLPIIGLEPSCLTTLRDEYLELFPHDPRAEALASSALLIEEFLTWPEADGQRPLDRLRFAAPQRPILVHGHCQAKAVVGMEPLLEMMRATGAAVREIDCGCCGMAGSFGYEAEHHGLSMQIGEMKLFPAVRAGVQQGALILAAGASCRAQIHDGTGVDAMHPIEALASALIQPRAS
jgi:FAD/FMN-containing dehydrogenase/Fe-S oxidoreductase